MSAESATSAGIRVPRLRALPWPGLAIAGVIVIAIGFAGHHWYTLLRHLESTDDAYVEATIVLLSARVGGTVIDVPARENQTVRAGDVLVKIDPEELEVRVARARADVDAARNRLEAARAGADVAEADGRVARVEQRRAEREAERLQELHESGAVSEQMLENAIAARDAARARVRAFDQRARAERAVLGNEAPLRQAEATLRAAELALSHTVVVAPRDGRIGRRNVEIGQNVTAEQPLMSLAADEPVWVVANFKETQVGRMREGAPVEVRVDAYPGWIWHGHVESFSPATGAKYALIPPDNATGNFTKVVQRLSVRIALDRSEPEDAGLDAPPVLSAGLSAEVSVHVGG